MKIKSINNPSVIITWDLRESSWPMKSSASCRSKIQFEIGQIVKKRYPLDPILEDITIPETRLSLDFYIPHRKIAVEVQGEQHQEMNPFFHKSLADFDGQKNRDDMKRFFCELNNIRLYEFKSISEAKKTLNV